MRNLVAREISTCQITDFGESLVLSFLPFPTNTSFLSEVLSEFPEIHGTAEGLEHLHARSFVGKRQ